MAAEGHEPTADGPGVTAEAVYRAYNEAENRHDWDATTALLAPNLHVMVNGHEAVSEAEEDRRAMTELVALFPGYRREILQIVGSAHEAAIRWVMSGSSNGDSPDLDVRGASFIRTVDGLITEAFLFAQGEGLDRALDKARTGRR